MPSRALLWDLRRLHLLGLDRHTRRLDRHPKWAASRGWWPAYCAPPTRWGESRAHKLGASLTGYVLTYSLMLLAYFVVLTHIAGNGAHGNIETTAVAATTAAAAGAASWTLDLPTIFALLMGVAILAYVVLDGYDLGVGMLMPAASPAEQDLMVASIGPFWDANETWLVLGVGLLLVALPGRAWRGAGHVVSAGRSDADWADAARCSV